MIYLLFYWGHIEVMGLGGKTNQQYNSCLAVSHKESSESSWRLYDWPRAYIVIVCQVTSVASLFVINRYLKRESLVQGLYLVFLCRDPILPWLWVIGCFSFCKSQKICKADFLYNFVVFVWDLHCLHFSAEARHFVLGVQIYPIYSSCYGEIAWWSVLHECSVDVTLINHVIPFLLPAASFRTGLPLPFG